MPELKLVAILDADKEGFLRSSRSLIQVAGRAARNAEGRVILYADTITDSMKSLLETTESRRAKQQAYNEANGIVPKTIYKAARETITDVLGLSPKAEKGKDVPYNTDELHRSTVSILREDRAAFTISSNSKQSKKGKLTRCAEPAWEGLNMNELLEELEKEMLAAAESLEFERAAQLRDQIRRIEGTLTGN